MKNWFVTFSIFAIASVAGSAWAEPLEQEARAAAKSLFDSIKWRDSKIQLSFKEIDLGSEFITGPQSSASIVHDENFSWKVGSGDEKIYICNYEGSPLLECRYQPKPGTRGSVTAFGENVRLTLYVLIGERPSRLEMQNSVFSGRVAAIQLDTLDKGDIKSFLINASEHFSDKYESLPEIDEKSSKARQLYSPECARDISIIEKKPISSLSQFDLDRQKKCKAEVFLRIFRGESEEQQERTMTWSAPGQNARARVQYKSSSPSEGFGTATASIRMYVDLNPDAVARFASAMQKLNEESTKLKQGKVKRDF